jgi:hypothetical protein
MLASISGMKLARADASLASKSLPVNDTYRMVTNIRTAVSTAVATAAMACTAPEF